MISGKRVSYVHALVWDTVYVVDFFFFQLEDKLFFCGVLNQWINTFFLFLGTLFFRQDFKCPTYRTRKDC